MSQDLFKPILTAFLCLIVFNYIIASENALESARERQISINKCFLRAYTAPVYQKPLKYRTLIGCLEWYESRGDEWAKGKAGECGCLQFMPSTWLHYCSDTLEDIWDCEKQKRCADEMITERWNNIYHWTTWKFCLQ